MSPDLARQLGLMLENCEDGATKEVLYRFIWCLLSLQVISHSLSLHVISKACWFSLSRLLILRDKSKGC